MLPKVYSPFSALPMELQSEYLVPVVEKVEPVSDETLLRFVESYTGYYRQTVEEFFPQVADSIPFYANAPFHTTIVRVGQSLTIIGRRKSDQHNIEVKTFEDFDPPILTPNIFDIRDRLRFETFSFFGSPLHFNEDNAKHLAVRDSLTAVLEFFWRTIPNKEAFQAVCINLMEAEGIPIKDNQVNPSGQLFAHVLLNEPADYRRVEQWMFVFKDYPNQRVSASTIHETEAQFLSKELPQAVCFITSEDLTSVGKYLINTNPRIRVWDRGVLNILVNKHKEVLGEYFDSYPKAVDELSRRIQEQPSRGEEEPANLTRFKKLLSECPSGQATFAKYESIGIEILRFLFTNHLGEPKVQSRTLDEKQRRDVLLRNNRSALFFDNIFLRHGADFVIVDFKNYGEEIGPDVITDVDKYANKALGRFILVISRKGQSKAVEATQLRTFRDNELIVLVLSDKDLLEMILRKERGQNPEDVLQDKLEQLLMSY